MASLDAVQPGDDVTYRRFPLPNARPALVSNHSLSTSFHTRIRQINLGFTIKCCIAEDMYHRQSALGTGLFTRDGSDSSPYSGLSSETESSDAPATAAQQERIQWHSMLASVVRG